MDRLRCLGTALLALLFLCSAPLLGVVLGVAMARGVLDAVRGLHISPPWIAAGVLALGFLVLEFAILIRLLARAYRGAREVVNAFLLMPLAITRFRLRKPAH